MLPEQNNTTAEDWLSFTEEDSSWLKAIELDESLQQGSDADIDWLLPLNALQDTPPTVSTIGTTASLAVNPQADAPSATPSLDNGLPTWDALDDFAQSPVYEEISQNLSLDGYSLDDLEAWEQEALQATQDPKYSDWTEVPSSLSEMALREAQQQEQMAWDVKDAYDVSQDQETKDFTGTPPFTYEVFEETEPPQTDYGFVSDHVPEQAPAYSYSEDIGDRPSEITEPSDAPQSQIDQAFEEIISEIRPVEKVGEFNFVADDFQQSEFNIAHLDQQDSFALPAPPAPASYLDNFELDPNDINIDLDIDLEEFRNSADSPPLHETFSPTFLPPLPPLPTTPSSEPDSSPSAGDKWANPAKQMSTGLNPDRRPFEAAPPSLITNVSPSKIDIFDLDENTDWSGLLEVNTAVNPDDASPAPTPVAPPPLTPSRPAAPKPSAVKPASPQPTARAKESPSPALYQEVRQFQELLDDSNLAAVNPVPPVVADVPLHSREVSGVHKVAKPQSVSPQIQLPQLPTLPWVMIAKFGGIAVAAIAVFWLGGIVFNRPLTEIGLRTGLWKDASGKDLARVALNDANLEDANFSNANLDGARLQNANLKGAIFAEARLNGVSLAGANLRGARMNRASVVFSDLTRADLSLVDLSDADLTRANLTGARLNGANLQGTKIGKPDTAEATRFDREAFLLWQALNEPAVGRNMSRTNFLGFRFNNADLRRANFTDSNLSFATFENAKLNGANFTGAKLNSANFNGADLSGAFLGNASWDRDKPPQSDAKTVCPDGKLGPCRF